MTAALRLVAGHALCDFPLQGDYLSKAKNPNAPTPGVPWWIAMGAHAAIHAGAVLLITGSIVFAVFEWFIHIAIDIAKCDGKTNLAQDQLLHLACKMFYITMLTI